MLYKVLRSCMTLLLEKRHVSLSPFIPFGFCRFAFRKRLPTQLTDNDLLKHFLFCHTKQEIKKSSQASSVSRNRLVMTNQ